jgi:hypothetical protein
VTDDFGFFEFDIEVENKKDFGILLDFPLRENLEFRKGFGKVKTFSKYNFHIVEGKKCLLLEPSSINLFREFDIPIEIEPNKYYSINHTSDLQLDLLDNDFNILYSTSEFTNLLLIPENIYFLKISPLKKITNRIQVEEGVNSTSFIEYNIRRKSNFLMINSYKNINIFNGRIKLEIYPLNNISKQYLFLHSNIKHPHSNISIYIEDNKLYLNDMLGENIILENIEINKWLELDVNFKGSNFNSNFFYIGDFINNFYGYVRNLKIYNNI